MVSFQHWVKVYLIATVLELLYSKLGSTKLSCIYWSLTKLHDFVLLGSQQESTPGRRDHSWEQLRLISLWLRKSKWKESFLGGIRSCVPKHFWVECNSQKNLGATEKCEFQIFERFLRLFNVCIAIICDSIGYLQEKSSSKLTNFSSYIFPSFPLYPKFSPIF